ncbi:MAG: hypothetical protein HC828_20735 [Blastochloris sp.]|nr:hypothetical protein [Blastochloris sp.]
MTNQERPVKIHEELLDPSGSGSPVAIAEQDPAGQNNIAAEVQAELTHHDQTTADLPPSEPSPSEGGELPRRYEVREREGGRQVLLCREAPGLAVSLDRRYAFSEQEARKQGYRIQIARLPMKYVARALETDETRGVMKAVIDAQTDQILGAAILGLEGGEVVTVIQTAMMGRLPYTALRDAAFSHPTLAESLNNLFSSLEA